MELDARENAAMADGFFRNDESHQRLLITYIRKYQPEIILANALDDRHPDHGRAGHLISDASFLSGLRKVETTDESGNPQTHWRPKYILHMIQDRYYHPTFVYDISPVMDRKIESIKAFSSQFFSTDYTSGEPQTYISTPEFLNSVIGRHAIFGKMIGVPYGEGFISEKMIGISSFDALIQKDT
jgi:bacillithiol biosynthesis deacetylase BshB1